MRRRLTLLLFLIILLPLVALVVVGIRIAEDREAVAATQFRSLLDDRLRDLSGAISQSRGELERGFVHALDGVRLTPEALRELGRREPLFSQVFLLDASGAVVFPPDDATRSRQEADFMRRTSAIWNRKAILYTPPAKEGTAPVRMAQSRAPGGRGDSLTELARRSSRGWIAWHWKEGLHLLFWRRLDDGRIAGAEIERIVLLSRIVGGLPSSDLADGRILLADSRGDPVYQWGPYEPESTAVPTARLVLDHPLDSWQLQYYASPSQRAAFLEGGTRLGVVLGLIAVATALFGLGAYLYRELSRDLREASQRVTFVTQVSHELKTPLSNIRLYAEMLESELEEDALEARSKVIVSESERLTRLIDNILTFAKHRRGQLSVERTEIRVDDVVRRVLGHFAPALRTKEIQATFDPGADRPVLADPDAVEQILANLISNVEKYGAGGGRLEITTTQDGPQTRIRVADDGPGIPEEHRARIFDAFHRVSDRLTDGVTGTGIGLTIARELAEQNGGRLELAASDAGACFVLTLETAGEGT